MRVAASLFALAFAACGPAVEPVAEIVSHTLTPGQVLKGSDTFQVTASGAGVVDATFGPRQVSRFVREENPVAQFSGREFPEGGAAITLSIQRNWSGLVVEDVWFDLTPPELVRVENAMAGPGATLRILAWDSISIASAAVKIGDFTVTRAIQTERASPELVPIEIAADPLAEGEWPLELTLTDEGGNQSQHTHPVVVDRTKPTAQILVPADGAEVSGSVDVVLRAEDNVRVAAVELRAGGSLVAVAGGGETAVTLDTSLFPVGALALEATPKDLAGNVGVPARIDVIVR